jgi:hypothetical protein
MGRRNVEMIGSAAKCNNFFPVSRVPDCCRATILTGDAAQVIRNADTMPRGAKAVQKVETNSFDRRYCNAVPMEPSDNEAIAVITCARQRGSGGSADLKNRDNKVISLLLRFHRLTD